MRKQLRYKMKYQNVIKTFGKLKTEEKKLKVFLTKQLISTPINAIIHYLINATNFYDLDELFSFQNNVFTIP